MTTAFLNSVPVAHHVNPVLPRSALSGRPVSSVHPARRNATIPTMVLQEVEHGGTYISESALEKARTGNKFEKIKLKKDGSAMWTEVHELSKILREGTTDFDDLDADDIEVRLKWAGLFHRKKRTPQRFMMRLKVPNGILNSAQLRAFGEILEPYGDDGCADITTRMNIQFRGVKLDDASDICHKLYDIGLTSFMSGMDNVRNMVGSPIAGIDPLEMIDTRPFCEDINNMITDNRRGRPELANLPRKFNICVSGSRDDFAHTHINDIGLIPMVQPATNEVGFNVVIGGMFSTKRNVESIPMDVWLPQEDVVMFCERLLIWFRDNGNRKNRMASRLMFMVDELGMEGFRSAIEEAVGKPLHRAVVGGPEYDTPFERRNVLGVHAQKQPGLSWVGALVPAGRLATSEFSKLADLADKYSNGELRLTVEQNIIFPNVANERVEELLEEELLQTRFSVRPGRISGGLVSCTGAQFCGLALIETKNRAIALAEELDRRFEVPRDLRMHWTGCPNSCGQAQVADIGLMGGPARKDGKAVEGVKIFVGGEIGEEGRLAELTKERVPVATEDLLPVLSEILIEKFGAKERKGAQEL